MSEGSFECLASSIIAGSISGVAIKTITAPIDRIRIIYQTNNARLSYPHVKYTIRKIIKEEGYQALFRGNSASCMRIVPYFAIQFYTHETLKSAFEVRQYEQKIANPVMSIAAGALSSGLAMACTYPLDVARARLATDTNYKSIYSVVHRAVVSRQACYGLYRGMSSAALAVIPYSCISLNLYEFAKMQLFPETDCRAVYKNWEIFTKNLALGTGIAFLGQTLVYPLDTVRRRMQVDTRHEELTFRHACWNVYRQFGWKGYYKAITLSWAKLPFVVGLTLAMYDYFYAETQKMGDLKLPKKLPKVHLGVESCGDIHFGKCRSDSSEFVPPVSLPDVPEIINEIISLPTNIVSTMEADEETNFEKVVMEEKEMKEAIAQAKKEAADAAAKALKSAEALAEAAAKKAADLAASAVSHSPCEDVLRHLDFMELPPVSIRNLVNQPVLSDRNRMREVLNGRALGREDWQTEEVFDGY